MARIATMSAAIVLIVLTGPTGCDSDPTDAVADLTFNAQGASTLRAEIRFRSVY